MRSGAEDACTATSDARGPTGSSAVKPLAFGKYKLDKSRRASAKRRAVKAGVVGFITSSEWFALLEAFDRRCAYCGTHGQGGRLLTLDHVLAISRGGRGSLNNVLPACHSCNSSKNALTLWEWSRVRMLKGLMPRKT